MRYRRGRWGRGSFIERGMKKPELTAGGDGRGATGTRGISVRRWRGAGEGESTPPAKPRVVALPGRMPGERLHGVRSRGLRWSGGPGTSDVRAAALVARRLRAYERRLWIGRSCVMQENGCGKYEDLARKHAEETEVLDRARRPHGDRWRGTEIARATDGKDGGSCVGGLLRGRGRITYESHARYIRGGAPRRREGQAHESPLRRCWQGARGESRPSLCEAEGGV